MNTTQIVNRLSNMPGELWQFRDLFFQLVKRNITLKYRRSFLGYLWSVLNPLMMMSVQALVFTFMFQRGIENYPSYLIAGNILFGFMRESTRNSIYSITGNASLLKKTYVPKYIFTISKVTSDFINVLFSLIAMFIVLLATGVPFYRSGHVFLGIVPLIELYVFCMGLSLFIAQASVFFRDIQNIWPVITNAWMYLTPLFYSIKSLPEPLAHAIETFNPMYIYITMFRNAVIYATLPEVRQLITGGIIAIIMLMIGIWSFLRAENKFILHI